MTASSKIQEETKAQVQKVPMDNYPTPPMTVPRFVALLNANGKTVSREWIYRLFKDGTLPSLRINRKILVFPDEVFAAMRSHSVVGK